MRVYQSKTPTTSMSTWWAEQAGRLARERDAARESARAAWVFVGLLSMLLCPRSHTESEFIHLNRVEANAINIRQVLWEYVDPYKTPDKWSPANEFSPKTYPLFWVWEPEIPEN